MIGKSQRTSSRISLVPLQALQFFNHLTIILYCSFTGSFSRLIVQDIELAPSYVIFSPGAFDISISLPLTMSFKADSVSFRAGLSILVALDSRRIRRGE